MSTPTSFEHVNPTEPERTAIAPYNFVPLPPKVVPAEPLPDLDCYHADRHTGTITCELTTASPLYVRCALTSAQFAAAEREKTERQKTDKTEERDARTLAKNTPEFFYTDDKAVPAIPGSSLRGMLRSLVEIVSYGKLDRITERKYAFRSLNDRQLYTGHFIQTLSGQTDGTNPRAPSYRPMVKAGRLRRRTNGWVIEECGYGRVDLGRGAARNAFYNGIGPKKMPNWAHQHKTIYVRIETTEHDHFFPAQHKMRDGRPVQRRDGSFEYRHKDLYLFYRAITDWGTTAQPGYERATLVVTGDMQFKHLEFVFLEENLYEHEVSDDLIRRFHDDDQLTQWQEDAFPRDQPTGGARERDGYLRDGEPVFFLLNDDSTIRFLGRAMLFRLPYPFSPRDYVSATHRGLDAGGTMAEPDIAEAIFGYVRQKKVPNDQARAGRIAVSDATLAEQPARLWETTDPIVPPILSGPKPTTFQHYLVQAQPDDQRQLRNYGTDPETVAIRGAKRYWHRGQTPKIALTPEEQADLSASQLTQIRPVAPGVTFRFTIRFEQLSDVELGALLWVLRLGAEPHLRLSLGMGKPLGMGAVSISSKVRASKGRTMRYSALLDDTGWTDGADDVDEQACVTSFEKYIIGHGGEPEKLQRLAEAPRIKELLALLVWPGPDVGDRDGDDLAQTRYMEIQRGSASGYIPAARYDTNRREANEYANRPVLPEPTDVLRIAKIAIPTLRSSKAPSSTSNVDPRINRKLDGVVIIALYDDGSVEVRLPEDMGPRARGVIAQADLRGRKVSRKEQLNVEVFGIQKANDGTELVLLRRRWNKKELAEGKGS